MESRLWSASDIFWLIVMIETLAHFILEPLEPTTFNNPSSPSPNNPPCHLQAHLYRCALATPCWDPKVSQWNLHCHWPILLSQERKLRKVPPQTVEANRCHPVEWCKIKIFCLWPKWDQQNTGKSNQCAPRYGRWGKKCSVWPVELERQPRGSRWYLAHAPQHGTMPRLLGVWPCLTTLHNNAGLPTPNPPSNDYGLCVSKLLHRQIAKQAPEIIPLPRLCWLTGQLAKGGS